MKLFKSILGAATFVVILSGAVVAGDDAALDEKKAETTVPAESVPAPTPAIEQTTTAAPVETSKEASKPEATAPVEKKQEESTPAAATPAQAEPKSIEETSAPVETKEANPEVTTSASVEPKQEASKEDELDGFLDSVDDNKAK